MIIEHCKEYSIILTYYNSDEVDAESSMTISEFYC